MTNRSKRVTHSTENHKHNGVSCNEKVKKWKRKQVPKACINCRKSHSGCDIQRPCGQCILHGTQATCIDVPRKNQRQLKQRKLNNSLSPQNLQIITTLNQNPDSPMYSDESSSPDSPASFSSPLGSPANNTLFSPTSPELQLPSIRETLAKLDPTASLMQFPITKQQIVFYFNIRENKEKLEREISRFSSLHLKLFQEDASKLMSWSSIITSYNYLNQETACCILLLVFHYVLYYGCEPEYWRAPLSDYVISLVPTSFSREYSPSIALEVYEMYHSLKMGNLPSVLAEVRRKFNPTQSMDTVDAFAKASTLSNQELLALQSLLTVSQH